MSLAALHEDALALLAEPDPPASARPTAPATTLLPGHHRGGAACSASNADGTGVHGDAPPCTPPDPRSACAPEALLHQEPADSTSPVARRFKRARLPSTRAVEAVAAEADAQPSNAARGLRGSQRARTVAPDARPSVAHTADATPSQHAAMLEHPALAQDPVGIGSARQGLQALGLARELFNTGLDAQPPDAAAHAAAVQAHHNADAAADADAGVGGSEREDEEDMLPDDGTGNAADLSPEGGATARQSQPAAAPADGAEQDDSLHLDADTLQLFADMDRILQE